MTAPVPKLVYRCVACDATSSAGGDVRACHGCGRSDTGDVAVINWDDPWAPGTPPILKPPQWGCHTISHARLGWCSNCRDVSVCAEVLAWRLHAMGEVVPGHAGAVAMSGQL